MPPASNLVSVAQRLQQVGAGETVDALLFTVLFAASPNASVATQPNTEKPLAFALPTYFRKVGEHRVGRRLLERQVTPASCTCRP